MPIDSIDTRNPGALAANVRALQDELTAMSLTLWRVLGTLEPQLLAAQQALGWSDQEAARWLANEVSCLEEPADCAGQVQVWLSQLRRTAEGFAG